MTFDDYILKCDQPIRVETDTTKKKVFNALSNNDVVWLPMQKIIGFSTETSTSCTPAGSIATLLRWSMGDQLVMQSVLDLFDNFLATSCNFICMAVTKKGNRLNLIDVDCNSKLDGLCGKLLPKILFFPIPNAMSQLHIKER